MPEFEQEQQILPLAEYKTMRQIADTARDTQITATLEAAEDAIVRYTQRDFLKKPTSETRKYPYDGQIVNIDDADEIEEVKINEQVLVADEDYIAMPYGEDVVWWLDLGPYTGRPASPLMGFKRNEDILGRPPFQFVTVKAKFGWTQSRLPKSLKIATAILVDEWASAATERRGISAEAVADTSRVYEAPEPATAPVSLPPAVESLLAPFRKVTL